MLSYTDPEISIQDKCQREHNHLESHERRWIRERLSEEASCADFDDWELSHYLKKMFDMDDEQLMQEGKDRGII